jgi:hypothetical protein
MIENKKTLFIPDTRVQIVYEKTEGDPFGSIVIQKTKIDDSEIVKDLEFFVDKNNSNRYQLLEEVPLGQTKRFTCIVSEEQ